MAAKKKTSSKKKATAKKRVSKKNGSVKKNAKSTAALFENAEVEELALSAYTEKAYLDYSMYVI